MAWAKVKDEGVTAICEAAEQQGDQANVGSNKMRR